MHVGFIIEHWDNIEPLKSSTILIIKECIKRGHKVSVLYTNNLTVRNNIVHGFIQTIKEMDKIPDNIVSFYKKVDFEKS